MKLKKKVKLVFMILGIIIIAVFGVFIYIKMTPKNEVKEVKILDSLEKYDYKLKETKSEKYKKLFGELKEILNEKNLDEEKYVKKISEMFIYDFYSLADKAAKTDVGGVDFLYKDVTDNFLKNAQDTYYKYVESNIYNERNQKLPEVGEIKILEVNQEEFAYGDNTDENAYYVNASWEYTDSEFSDYQKEATLVFIHDGEKLSLVELQ